MPARSTRHIEPLLPAAAAAGPAIGLSKTTSTLTVLEGNTTVVQDTVTITNTGTGTLAWSQSDDAAWLSASPSSGGTGATLTISADPLALPPAVYVGTVTVTDGGASNSPQTVTVTFTVAQIPMIAMAPASY